MRELSENILFDIFLNLDAVNLSKISIVCNSWYNTILECIRYMFSIPFKSYPQFSSKEKLSNKTIFLILKKLHFINSKSCGELLFWSCARGYTAFLNHFINNIDNNKNIQLLLPPIKYSLNAISKIDNMTSLHIASKHNQLEIIKILLSHPQIDINKLTKSGKHSLIIAAEKSNFKIIDELIKHKKLNINQIDYEQKSLLHIACSMGNKYLIYKLLENKDININIIDKENRTPLYIAAENGYIDICKCLLSSKKKNNNNFTVNIHLSSKSGKSPLYVAAENGHVSVVAYLLKKGANVRQETCRGKIALYAAAEKQYVNIVKEILPFTQEKDLFKLTHYGTTAMFIASKQSNKTVKKMLISFCKNNNNDNNNNNNNNNTINNIKRPQTPKFAQQFETFQELQQKQNKKKSNKITPFLQRMEKIENTMNEDDEEKDKSVPRIMDNPRPRPRPKPKPRQKPKYSHSVSLSYSQKKQQKQENINIQEEKEQDQSSDNELEKIKKCTFDYNRLYKGELRNKQEKYDIKEIDENKEKEIENTKKWKGFSQRFMIRNLINKKQDDYYKINDYDDDYDDDDDDEIDPDEILKQEVYQKEKDRISREAASKFLQRQKDKIIQAQIKAKERINEYKKRDIIQREILIKKREQARVMAMKVAQKIADRQKYDDDITIIKEKQYENKIELETQSDPCLNLFDKLRKKPISNENFKNDMEYNIFDEDCSMKLNSHRSMTVLDKIKMEKKRSLQVTGKILKVLSDRKSKSSNGYKLNLNIDDNDNYDGIENEDGYLLENDICFLHPLSKKKKNKLKRNKLEKVYGINNNHKKKKKKKTIITRKNGNELNCLLQIATINPLNRC